MDKKPEVLRDHYRRGKFLVPPFIHRIKPFHGVSWVKTMIPELCWIGLIQSHQGLARGVELVSSMAKTARNVIPEGAPKIFAPASNYSNLSDAEWARWRKEMAGRGELFPIQQSLEPLISLYPKCPLKSIFAAPLTAVPVNALARMKALVSALFPRSKRDPMMVQATAMYLAFQSGFVFVNEGLPLAEFTEIERYPNTEISRKVASGIRAFVNIFFGEDKIFSYDSKWPEYFWNNGLAISNCEFSNE